MKTIEEAKKYLRENMQEGVPCPCCTQMVKIYKRKLTSGMAVALIRLYHESGGDTSKYVHITKLGHLNGGEFAQLKRWNLIEEAINEDTSKRTSGTWAITPKGIKFVKRQIEVPSHLYTFDSKTVGVVDETVDIKTALGRKFNYAEMMQ